MFQFETMHRILLTSGIPSDSRKMRQISDFRAGGVRHQLSMHFHKRQEVLVSRRSSSCLRDVAIETRGESPSSSLSCRKANRRAQEEYGIFRHLGIPGAIAAGGAALKEILAVSAANI